MKKLLAIMLALLVCAGLSGCALEKVAPVGASVPLSEPTVVGHEPEWNEDEVDARIPDEYLYSDGDAGDDWDEGDYEGWDEGDFEGWEEGDYDDWYDGYEDEEGYDDEDYEADYGISRTLTPAPEGTAVDGNPVDFIISDDLFSSQIDEISYFSDEYVGKRFAVIGYVMLPIDLEDKNGFAVVRDFQEPHSDDEEDGEFMTAEEFAALIDSLGEAEGEVEGVAVAEQTAAPTETPDSDSTPVPTDVLELDSTPTAGIEIEPGATVSFDALATLIPEEGAQVDAGLNQTIGGEEDASDGADDAFDDEDVADEGDEGDHEHEHEIYPVGIDCYFEGEIPPDDAWVRVVGTLEEYDYYDSEADESFPALRLRVQSVTTIPETEGGSRLVTQ